MNQLWFLHNYEKKKTYVIPLFTPTRYLILLYMESYFSAPNNTKYLVSSLTLTNPSIFLNLIRKGLASTKFLQEIL